MFTGTTHTAFDRQIDELFDQVLFLGSLVQQAVLQAVAALERGDHNAARDLCDRDERINECRYAIENACVVIIATRQPMARDVRVLAAVLEVISDLERIGDYAKGIGKLTVRMGDEKADPVVIQEISHIASRAEVMLERALAAFIQGDAATARDVSADDDEIDQLYNRVYWRLIALVMANRTTVELASYLMWAAHNLERMADRVTNICERTVYVATGKTVELDHMGSQDPTEGKLYC